MPEIDVSLIWFRRDLRLDDHAALYHALKSSRAVYPVFVFDTDILDSLTSPDDRRVEFIHESVSSLKAELEALGSTLHVLHGPARKLIPEIARQIGARAVFCNRDYEPFTIHRDREVERSLKSGGIGFNSFKDQVIFEQGEVLTQACKPFGVFTPYKNAWLKKIDAFYLKPYPVRAYIDGF